MNPLKFNQIQQDEQIYRKAKFVTCIVIYRPVKVKTPKQKVGKSPKSPTTPKETLPLPEIQAKMAEAVKKVG